MHDIKLTYFCDNTWDIVATLKPTEYSKTKGSEDIANDGQYDNTYRARLVNPKTCEVLHPETELSDKDTDVMKSQNMTNEEYFEW